MAGAPEHLKGALKAGLTQGEGYLLLVEQPASPVRRAGTVAATVGGAAGVAVLCQLSFGAAPADAPTADRQVPTTSVTVPAYGPGVLDLAHQPDEWVGIDDMVAAAQVMARAAYGLLHGER